MTNDPFIKKGTYSKYAKINKEEFIYLIDRIKQLGFKKIQIKTPKIIIESSLSNPSKPIEVEDKNIYSENEFLNLERDFRGIILAATNDTETIKILFFNRNNYDLVFEDDNFSVVKKTQESRIYVSSNNAVHTYTFINIIQDYMEEHTQGKSLTYFLTFLLSLIAIGMLFAINFLDPKYKNIFFPISLLLIVPIILFLPQTGLHLVVKKRNLPDAILELKKNSLVIILSILGTIIAQYLFNLYIK